MHRRSLVFVISGPGGFTSCMLGSGLDSEELLTGWMFSRPAVASVGPASPSSKPCSHPVSNLVSGCNHTCVAHPMRTVMAKQIFAAQEQRWIDPVIVESPTNHTAVPAELSARLNSWYSCVQYHLVLMSPYLTCSTGASVGELVALLGVILPLALEGLGGLCALVIRRL